MRRILPLACLCLLGLTIAVSGGEEQGGTVTTLPEVTVTPTRNPRSMESLTGTAKTVDRDDLDLQDAWTVEEALREVPGVEIVGNARYGQEVRFNTRGVTSGYGTQRTLVLLDGRPLTDEYLGNVDLAQYPLRAMRRVELVRGPASSVYGTNALSGVLNLLPRRGGTTPETEISAEGGSFGTSRASLSHGNMLGPVDLFLTLQRTETDGYLRNSRRDRMDWETLSAFVNLGFEQEDYSVRMYGAWFDGEGTDEDFDRESERNLEDLLFTYRVDPEMDADLKLRLYRSQLDQTLDWFNRPETTFDQLSWGAILTQTLRVGGDHLLTGGLEWRRESAEVQEAAGPVDETATTISAFLQDEFAVAENFDLVFGLRFDDRSEIDPEISWRGGLSWRPVSGTTVRGAVGRAFRAPTISDQFLPTTSYFGLVFEGNPGLKPETLLSLELGVDQEVWDGVLLSVTGFASKFDDFWDFLPDTDGVFRPQNIAEVRIRGLETTLVADLGLGISLVLGYTLTDARYETFRSNQDVEDNRLDDNVKHRGSANLTWRHEDGHAVRLGVMVSGDRYTDPENTGAGHLDGFYVAELQAEARITDWASVTLSVQNAFNHGYRTRPEYREPGRAVFAGLRLTF